MSLALPFLRAGSPIQRPEGPEGETYHGWQQKEKREQRGEALNAFASAVRAKPRWYFEILQQQELSDKWKEEAQIEGGDDLESLLRDLKSEARRIAVLDHSIRLKSSHLDERPIDFDPIVCATAKASLYLQSSQHGIDKPQLYEDVGAYYADDVVPKNLHSELVRELDALAAIEPKDYCPGSSGQVQELIDPSLYPYMVNVTPLPKGVDTPETIEGRIQTMMALGEGAINLFSNFGWIPTVFQASEDGQQFEIQDYINGLGPREHFPVLFKLIEQAFRIAMPMLEKAVSRKFERTQSASWRRWDARRQKGMDMDFAELNEEYENFVARQKQEKADEEAVSQVTEVKRLEKKVQERVAFFQNAGHSFSGLESVPAQTPKWAGQQAKVIIKAINYILQPGEEYSGAWQMEGMPHERIVASAIYCYEQDPSIIDAGLYLRRKRDLYDDFPSMEDNSYPDFRLGDNEEDEDGHRINNPSDYGSQADFHEIPGYINVGIVPTTDGAVKSAQLSTGRIIAFPDWLQHRAVSIKNDSSAGGPAKKKILCFFLVKDGDLSEIDEDDHHHVDYPGFEYWAIKIMDVLTTSDVPSQARGCNTPTLTLLLGAAFRSVVGKNLPAELSQLIFSEMNGVEFGLSREKAEERRRAIMADRGVQIVGINELWQDNHSLNSQ